MICVSAYHRNKLGGPSYHNRSKGFICNPQQYDRGAYKYGIYGHSCS